jgi:hypothetical protein
MDTQTERVGAQTIAEMITALTAIGALVFTGLSLISTRDQVAAAQAQNLVAEQGQITERYTKAIELLDTAGPEHLQGRLGAVYALERLARDSPPDQPTIIEVLSAFIRTATKHPPRTACPDRPVSEDVQAAASVLGRRITAHDNGTEVDLHLTCLRNAKLDGADFAHADLSGIDLSYASLHGANLPNVNLAGADVIDASLRGAKLHGADLTKVNVKKTDLTGVDLTRADLTKVRHDSGTIVTGTRTDERTTGEWW